jgi:hypothetical protein
MGIFTENSFRNGFQNAKIFLGIKSRYEGIKDFGV